MSFLQSNPPRLGTWTLGLVIMCFVGCAKEGSLGPDLESLYGDLEFTESFSHNMPNGVHFEQGDTVRFSCGFNLPVAYTLSLTGQTSGATYAFQGQGNRELDVLWFGGCDNVFFRKNEWVHCLLEFPDHPDDFKLDSVFVWEQPDLSNRGLLLASFEETNPIFSISSGEFTESLDVVTEALDAVEGGAYMRGVGAGAGSWFGALRLPLDPQDLLGSSLGNTYLNVHLRSDYEGSASVIKLFEDSNGDGLVTSGEDEVFTTKLAVNAGNTWQRISIPWSDFELDLSGNNVSLNGQIDLDQISRLDCTVSQTGTASGTYGLDVDYVILTFDQPF